jgi:hypothetical protein
MVDSVPRRFDGKRHTSDARKGSCKGPWADKVIKTRRVWYRFIQSDGSDVSVAGGYRVWCGVSQWRKRQARLAPPCVTMHCKAAVQPIMLEFFLEREETVSSGGSALL